MVGAIFVAITEMSTTTTTTTKPAAKGRPVFVLELRPEPGVDAVKALRAVLKITLRRYGLRCISARENIEEENHATQTTQNSSDA
jgi:hypothetical protein